LNAVLTDDERTALLEPTPRKKRKSSSSPTQRTLKELRKRGCPLVQVVERWNPHARVRQDLFGIIDVIAIAADGDIIAVQACSGGGGDAAERVRKISDSPALPHLRKAEITILVHAWRKNSVGKWVLREIDLS
jgi:hypothetical protein